MRLLYQKIAEIIEDEVRISGATNTVREYAMRLRVCVSTVRRAIRDLEQKGILETHLGRRATPCTREPCISPLDAAIMLPASQRASAAIRDGIANGILASGEALPKMSVMAKDCGISLRTMGSVIKNLACAGLVHKESKCWIVGPPRSVSAPARPARMPIVLLIELQKNAWQSLIDTRTGDFVRRFSSELRLLNCRIVCAVIEPRVGSRTAGLSGIEGVQAFLSREYHLCRGALVVGRDKDPEVSNELLRMLSRQKLPAAWFDRTQDIIDGEGAAWHGCIRCGMSERRFSSAGIRELARHGHSRIGFLRLENSAAWVDRRIAHVREEAAGLGIDVVLPMEVKAMLSDWGVDRLARKLRAALGSGRSRLSKLARYLSNALEKCAAPMFLSSRDAGVRSRLLARFIIDWEDIQGSPLRALWNARALFFLLAHEEITALILPRDKTVPIVLSELDMMRISCPREISLVSYDNELCVTQSTVSTVDSGAADLGYRVSHALLGDIPVSYDAARTIIARPTIDNRGSIETIGARDLFRPGCLAQDVGRRV